MELIAGIVCLLVAQLGGKDNRNPIKVFCFFWAVLFLAGALYWTGLDHASYKTIIIMIVGIVSFAVGGKFRKILSITRCNKQEIYHQLFINLICLVGSAYWTFKMMRALPYLLSTGSFALLRKEFWIIGGSITPGIVDYILNMFFANGIALAVPAIAFTELFNGRKRPILIISSIYMSIMNALCNGGRLTFMNLAVCLLGALVLSGKTSNIKQILKSLPRYTKRILRLVLVLIVLAGVFLTIQRQGLVSNVLESIYNYFTLQFSLMSKTLELLEVNQDITYGATTTMGITQPFAMCLQFLGLIEYPEIYNILAKYTSPYFDVGASILYNAFVSQFFFFYLDGRIFGVIIFDFILGMTFESWFIKIDSKQSFKYKSMYVIALVAIVQSSFRFSFTYPSNIIALLVIWCTYFPKKLFYYGRNR